MSWRHIALSAEDLAVKRGISVDKTASGQRRSPVLYGKDAAIWKTDPEFAELYMRARYAMRRTLVIFSGGVFIAFIAGLVIGFM
jgi:hypothetical protein